MIQAFNRWPKNFKILLFFSILMVFSAVNYLLFISHPVDKIRSLQAQKLVLNNQWQQRHAQAVHQQQLQRDILLLQYPYLNLLHTLQKPMTPADIYSQITLLAKTHSLQIIALNPQKIQSVSGFEKLLFNLDLSGAELKLLNFLQLLMHQPWLLEIQQLELEPHATGIHLQATLAAYYAAQ